MFKRILVPTDGSEVTSKAVGVALELARTQGAQLFTVSVKEPFPYSAISEMQPIPPQEFFDARETFFDGVEAPGDVAPGGAAPGSFAQAVHLPGEHPIFRLERDAIADAAEHHLELAEGKRLRQVVVGALSDGA